MEPQSFADSSRVTAPRIVAAAGSAAQILWLALSLGSTGRTRQGYPHQACLGSTGWSGFQPAVAG